ncbi:uncharacterized protein [Diadema setosum]|uniref:uncharacterized protein n=1 Tax=Diadema setosum TaxID=31175 RepID=UPI003B3ADBB2
MSVDWILRLCALCFALSTGLESAPAAVSAASSSSRCPNVYTWNSGRYGYELLKPKDEMCGSSTLCMSPYPRPASSDEYPPPVPTDSVQLEFIGEPANNSTCLKITYHLDQYGAVNILGMQFLLHGLGYNSHNTHCCQILNYTVPLGYDAAFRNGQNYDFIFDCFCDLWPQEEYRLTIRSLPVDFENQSLIDDSSYVEDFVVPACTPARSWDQYCQQSKEEQWRPQHIVLQQIFPDYTRMTVTFNIAPFSYRFTCYVVSLYENGGSARPLSVESAEVGEPEFIVFEINMDGLRMNATNVTFELAKEHLGKEVFAEILPRCDSNVDCLTGAVASDTIVILDHPCKSNPCTDLGVCSLDGLEYVCDCNDSAINTGKTCIPNPCQSNPCDPYSTCEIDEDTFKHNCGCPNGVTCISLRHMCPSAKKHSSTHVSLRT